jgi:hypothetical protein
MPNWRKFVQSKLAELKLAAGPKEDVIDELADHLEEAYEDLRGRVRSRIGTTCSAVFRPPE